MTDSVGEPQKALCPTCKENSLGVPRDNTFVLRPNESPFLCFTCWFKYYAMGEKDLRVWYKNKELKKVAEETKTQTLDDDLIKKSIDKHKDALKIIKENGD